MDSYFLRSKKYLLKDVWLPKQLRTEKITYSSEKSVEELRNILKEIVNDRSLFRIDKQFMGEMTLPVKFKLYLPKLSSILWFTAPPCVVLYLYTDNNQTFVEGTYHVSKGIIYGYILSLIYSVWIVIPSLFFQQSSLMNIISTLGIVFFVGFLILGIGEFGKVRLKRELISTFPIKVLRKESQT